MNQEELNQGGRHVRSRFGMDVGEESKPSTAGSLPLTNGFDDQSLSSIPIGRK
jgi:hypothetical protein